MTYFFDKITGRSINKLKSKRIQGKKKLQATT